METNYQIALLIDAENINVKYIDAIIKEIAKYGTLVISRFYGDISKLSNEWKKKALDYAIRPMHQFHVAQKKNAADMAMALDAQEIMYNNKVNCFFIISSDSDFTPLSSKLREGGMYVVGIGKEGQVSSAFRSSCNEFKYFEYLMKLSNGESEENEETDKSKSPISSDDTLQSIIKEIIIENGENNRLLLSRLGHILVNRFSDFDPRKYGAKQLKDLVLTLKGLSIQTEGLVAYVALDTEKERTYELIYTIISRNKTKKMELAKLHREIIKEYKNFNYEDYGFIKFGKFLQSIPRLKVKNNIATLK